MLVEFASAVEAVRCAVEVQRGYKTRLSRIPPLPPEVAERVIALTQAGPRGVNAACTWT
jgi:hypothetical protein